MSESAIKHTIFWFWILLAVFAFVGVATLVLNKPPKQAEIKPEEPPKEIPIDYVKVVGMWHDEAIFAIHGQPPKHYEENSSPNSPPTIETWTINNIHIKLAVVNDKVIGVQIGSLDWTGKEPCER